MRPMLAVKGDRVPTGGQWLHEVKWDGMRILADVGVDVGAGGVRLSSRNENDVTAAWPDIAEAPPPGRDLLVDGEVIALDESGRPDFRVLQERMHVRNAASVRRLVGQVPATYLAFDLLRLDGRDLRDQPLELRRERLSEVLAGSLWQVPPAYDEGETLHAATLAQGLEGIVSKRRESRYVAGERSRAWLKFAHRHRGSYVVGAWRPQEGSPERLGSVLVGEVTAEGLRYRGRVGSGIGPKQSPVLRQALTALAAGASPFVDEVPREDARGVHWVAPVMVIDVDTHGLGYQRLRQPSYRGVRSDLTPEDLANHPPEAPSGDRAGRAAPEPDADL